MNFHLSMRLFNDSMRLALNWNQREVPSLPHSKDRLQKMEIMTLKRRRIGQQGKESACAGRNTCLSIATTWSSRGDQQIGNLTSRYRKPSKQSLRNSHHLNVPLKKLKSKKRQRKGRHQKLHQNLLRSQHYLQCQHYAKNSNHLQTYQLYLRLREFLSTYFRTVLFWIPEQQSIFAIIEDNLKCFNKLNQLIAYIQAMWWSE